MSMADPPVYSNGDKTVTVQLKTSYRWSDGQPVTSKDVLFFIDLLRAAVKESGANWGLYTPHIGLPDQVASASTPNATTLVLNLTKPANPQWFTADGLYYINPLPAHAWAKASPDGPVLDFTNPANAKKIYDFLAKAVRLHRHLRDQPAVAGRGRPVPADRVQQHHRRLHHGTQPQLRRAAFG